MVGTILDSFAIAVLYDSGKSTREIANEFDTSHTRIRNVLVSNGIKLRDKRESLLKFVRFNTCVVCGGVFRPRENWKSTSRADRKTCSDDCKHILDSRNHTHENGHSQSFYQRKRREYWEDICADCYTTKNIETHHIDRDVGGKQNYFNIHT
jgi:predicted nucleic acid-binding Zn ribbon protein